MVRYNRDRDRSIDNPLYNSPAYVAGVIDSDGSIIIGKATIGNNNYLRYNVSVYITQVRTDTFFRWLLNRFGGCVTYNKGGISNWVAVGKTAAPFLLWIYPHIILKRKEVELAIEFTKTILPNSGSRGKLTNDVVKLRESLFQRCRAEKRKRKEMIGKEIL